MLEAQSLTLNYGEKNIIENLNLIIPKGEITVLVGANGCGKSTLLRSLARLMKPKSGDIVLNGDLIKSLPTKEIAKRMAILPQGPIAPEGLTVQQLAKQGRYPYQSWRKQWSKDDEDIVNEALRATGMSEFKNKPVNSLSGGQRQRAWIAMTLAQKTNTILLDEPTTYLDMYHQMEILELIKRLNKEHGMTIVMVLHDLNQAIRYSDHLIVLKDGQKMMEGEPAEIINSKSVRDIYGVKADVKNDEESGLYIVPIGI
uniref:Cobalamin/Fe3+-siderophores transporter n=1 Tax=Alkalihalobacillus alcalophilus ATCC 27647 = CGMCC 1.3604 TaxID=1218173 RepID=J8TWG3_ALKAL|nr:cobalamin/Fe3+-siderophores transporter [Alkalihalobacillus alcalophilus ATCC 27647 = CGMCC 1.3604]